MIARKTKRCTHCGLTKPVAEFSKNSRTSDGLQSWCNNCVRMANRSSRRCETEHIPSDPIMLAYRKAALVAQAIRIRMGGDVSDIINLDLLKLRIPKSRRFQPQGDTQCD